MPLNEVKGIWPGLCFGRSPTNHHGLQLRFYHTVTVVGLTHQGGGRCCALHNRVSESTC